MPVPASAAKEAIIDREGLQALLEALSARGFSVTGPRVRDGAVVYETVRDLTDLPAGWTDRQEGGSYRLERRGGRTLDTLRPGLLVDLPDPRLRAFSLHEGRRTLRRIGAESGLEAEAVGEESFAQGLARRVRTFFSDRQSFSDLRHVQDEARQERSGQRIVEAFYGDGMLAVLGEAEDPDCLLVAVEDPVFGDSRLTVNLDLVHKVDLPGRRGKNLDRERRDHIFLDVRFGIQFGQLVVRDVAEIGNDSFPVGIHNPGKGKGDVALYGARRAGIDIAFDLPLD